MSLATLSCWGCYLIENIALSVVEWCLIDPCVFMFVMFLCYVCVVFWLMSILNTDDTIVWCLISDIASFCQVMNNCNCQTIYIYVVLSIYIYGLH